MEIDDELVLIREQTHFHAVVENAKRGFGEWDLCDPVSWAILRVVRAQTDFAHAVEENVAYGENDDVVEAAIAERIKAIVALQEAIKQANKGRRGRRPRPAPLLDLLEQHGGDGS
jgi:hypothetical protein